MKDAQENVVNLLWKDIGKLLKYNSSQAARIEQLKEFIWRHGLEVPEPESNKRAHESFEAAQADSPYSETSLKPQEDVSQRAQTSTVSTGNNLTAKRFRVSLPEQSRQDQSATSATQASETYPSGTESSLENVSTNAVIDEAIDATPEIPHFSRLSGGSSWALHLEPTNTTRVSMPPPSDILTRVIRRSEFHAPDPSMVRESDFDVSMSHRSETTNFDDSTTVDDATTVVSYVSEASNVSESVNSSQAGQSSRVTTDQSETQIPIDSNEATEDARSTIADQSTSQLVRNPESVSEVAQESVLAPAQETVHEPVYEADQETVQKSDQEPAQETAQEQDQELTQDLVENSVNSSHTADVSLQSGSQPVSQPVSQPTLPQTPLVVRDVTRESINEETHQASRQVSPSAVPLPESSFTGRISFRDHSIASSSANPLVRYYPGDTTTETTQQSEAHTTAERSQLIQAPESQRPNVGLKAVPVLPANSASVPEESASFGAETPYETAPSTAEQESRTSAGSERPQSSERSRVSFLLPASPKKSVQARFESSPLKTVTKTSPNTQRRSVPRVRLSSRWSTATTDSHMSFHTARTDLSSYADQTFSGGFSSSINENDKSNDTIQSFLPPDQSSQEKIVSHSSLTQDNGNYSQRRKSVTSMPREVMQAVNTVNSTATLPVEKMIVSSDESSKENNQSNEGTVQRKRIGVRKVYDVDGNNTLPQIDTIPMDPNDISIRSPRSMNIH